MIGIDYSRVRPKMVGPCHVARSPPSYRDVSEAPPESASRKDKIMNVRAFLVVPAALAVAVLAGCGQTDGGSSGKGGDSGSARIGLLSTEVCHAPAYIRERAPEGFCSDTDETPVDDNLSPLQGDR